MAWYWWAIVAVVAYVLVGFFYVRYLATIVIKVKGSEIQNFQAYFNFFLWPVTLPIHAVAAVHGLFITLPLVAAGKWDLLNKLGNKFRSSKSEGQTKV